MAVSTTDIEEFLAGPLATWMATCIKKPDSLQIYETFFDGNHIIEVLSQIDPEPSEAIPFTTNVQGLNITSARIKIFHYIVRTIKAIYEEELGQIVVALPDCFVLGRLPGSEEALQQLKLLLLLLLGCAVQGPTKESFITKIKQLPVDAQHGIVECIKQVTDDQNMVLTVDWTEQSAQKLYTHVRSLSTERDKFLDQLMIDMSQEAIVNGAVKSTEGIESNHLAVELADWKARLRKQRQELEEKTEILAEVREELEYANNLVGKLKIENSDLLVEARRAKSYRDEADAMREKAERADRLEVEAQRYRERLADAEFYKVRVDELREDNVVMLETKDMLETQLARARQRADQVLDLEAQLLNNKKIINELVIERDAAREKIQELLDENIQLQHVTKTALQETSVINIAVESDNDDGDDDDLSGGNNSLSEQLTKNAQTRALRLELENKKLLSTIDSLKENSFANNANNILDIEKEKKKITLKCEQFQETCERLKQQNNELEDLFKNAIQENRKLHEQIHAIKSASDRQLQDLQNERIKIVELEKNVELLTKEKQRTQILCDTIKKRADDTEKSLTQTTDQMRLVEIQAEQGKVLEKLNNDITEKMTSLEKDNSNMQKEITKLKEFIETKDVSLDKQIELALKQEKEIQKLTKENEITLNQIEKLQEFEQKNQELVLQTTINAETISTLQKDLIIEKINNEKFKTNLDKLGLNSDIIDNDINIIVEKILENPDVTKYVNEVLMMIPKNQNDNQHHHQDEVFCRKCSINVKNVDLVDDLEDAALKSNQQCKKLFSELNALQNQNDALQNDNAKLQVDISTLKSQVHSLQTQQTALQLANSQLVAEKDELSKQQQLQNNHHDTLLLDQVTLRTLHEQLNTEYEELIVEQETLKKLNRDLRTEIRTMKEMNGNYEERIAVLELEKDTFKNDAKNLSILRTEHSKLKDDFRNLFTASERLKLEYRSVQDELKSLRTESRTLRLGHTEMQGELNTRSDVVAGLQLDNSKLQQKCDMLFEMNHTLDSDRRALMDHVSQLLSQYHSLLTHSLEDKQHYHLEEKLYTDKVNNLCRQKEKLEEKIMEHYRKLDNASSKKRGFGATLVKRVRKAGSDIINKVPSRNRRSWHEDTSRLTQSQFTIGSAGITGGGGGSGESVGNDSDNSLMDTDVPDKKSQEPFKRATIGGSSLHGHRPRDEIALRRSHRDLVAHRNSIAGDQNYTRDLPPAPGSTVSLGSVGSRRTVYLSEDESTATTAAAATATSQHQQQTTNDTHSSQAPPLIVYNRVSTVIGGDVQRSTPVQSKIPEENLKESTSAANASDKKQLENSKETAVWYEYGCV